MLLAPDSMRLSPEEREEELGPPRESDEEEDDEPPPSEGEGGVAHSADERYRRSPAEPPVGKRPLKEPPESRVEPNMPDRVASASASASAGTGPAAPSSPPGGGLRGLVPRKSPALSLLKTSSPREAMTRSDRRSTCSADGRSSHSAIVIFVLVKPTS